MFEKFSFKKFKKLKKFKKFKNKKNNLFNKRIVLVAFVLVGLVLFLTHSSLASLSFFSTDSLNKGLVGHWPLDGEHFNSSTNRVDDISGYQNYGTNSGASLTTGIHGGSENAMDFDGSGDYVDVPDDNSLDMGTNDFSIGFWINYKGSTVINQTHGTVVDKSNGNSNNPGFFAGITTYGGNGSNYGIVFSTTNGAWGTGNIEHTGAYDPNIWYYIMGVRSNNTWTIYKNGVYAKSGSKAGIAVDVDNNYDFQISTGSWGYVNGSVQDVRIYNRALSESEIKKLYEKYQPKLSTGGINKKLVGHWPLKPSSDSTARSCKAILDNHKSTGDGVYKIDPDGPGGNDSFEVYCDMTTDGGGWTLAYSTIAFIATSSTGDYSIASAQNLDSSKLTDLNASNTRIGHYIPDNADQLLWVADHSGTIKWWETNVPAALLDTVNTTDSAGSQEAITLNNKSANASVSPSYFMEGSNNYPNLEYFRLADEVDTCGSHAPLTAWGSFCYAESCTLSPTGSCVKRAIDGTQISANATDSKYYIYYRKSSPLEDTADTTPNSNHGEVHGSDIRNHGIYMQGDASPGYVDIDGLPQLGTGNWTIAAWYKLKSNDDYHHIFTADSQYDFAFKISKTPTVYFYSSETGSVGVSDTLSLNRWYFFVAQRDGSDIKVWIDGTLKTTGSASTLNIDVTDFHIGKYGNEYSHGNQANTLVYDRALSGSEVLDLYNGKDVPGAVLDMPLSQKTGFKDISGNGNHGTNNGSVLIGEAGYFDGSNDYVDVGIDTSITSIADTITASAWVKTSANDKYQIIVGRANDWRLKKQNSNYGFEHRNNSNQLQTPTATNTSTDWLHVVGVYDRYGGVGNCRLYVNGILKDAHTQTGPTRTSQDENYIGSSWAWHTTGTWNDYFFDGQISDVHIYNRALSDGGVSVGQDAKGEIGALYAKGRSRSSVGTSTTNLNKGLVLDMPLKSENEKVGPELLLNTDFSGYSGTSPNVDFDVWGESEFSGAADFDYDGGGKITVTQKADSGYHIAFKQNFSDSDLIVGKTYKMFTKTKTDQSSEGSIRVTVRGTGGSTQNSPSHFNISSSDGWTKIKDPYFTVENVDTNRIQLECGAVSEWTTPYSVWFKDVSIKEVQTADTTPYSNHGDIYGATVGDDYTSFDGTNDYVGVPNTLIDSLDGYTITLWAKSNGILDSFNMPASSSGGHYWYIDHNDNDRWHYSWKDSSGTQRSIYGDNTVNEGQWYHIVVTNDGSNQYMYIDGVQQSDTDNKIGFDVLSLTALIGTYHTGGTYAFGGSINKIHIYNRALSQQEVETLFDKERGQFGI